jgi:hypothetical protein
MPQEASMTAKQTGTNEEETTDLIKAHGLDAARHCDLYEVKTCVQ